MGTQRISFGGETQVVAPRAGACWDALGAGAGGQCHCPLATVLSADSCRSCQDPASEAAGAQGRGDDCTRSYGARGPRQTLARGAEGPGGFRASLCLPLGSQLSAVKANLWFLAIFVGVPVSAALYHVTRKR